MARIIYPFHLRLRRNCIRKNINVSPGKTNEPPNVWKWRFRDIPSANKFLLSPFRTLSRTLQLLGRLPVNMPFVVRTHPIAGRRLARGIKPNGTVSHVTMIGLCLMPRKRTRLIRGGIKTPPPFARSHNWKGLARDKRPIKCVPGVMFSFDRFLLYNDRNKNLGLSAMRGPLVFGVTVSLQTKKKTK